MGCDVQKLRYEMTDSTTTRDPAITRDAKAWRDAAGVNYTEALRLIEDPLHQGLLGDRIVIRDLLRTLDEHPIIGSEHASTTFGRNGLSADEPMVEDLSTGRPRETLLAVEFLRMFTPVTATDLQVERNWTSSYGLKHAAEEFLGGTVHRYVSNGSLIWAAALLGLPMRTNDIDPTSKNVEIALLHQEVAFVRADSTNRLEKRQGKHYMPPGYKRLKAAMKLANKGESITEALNIPIRARGGWSEFHLWLADQVDRDGFEGRFASDYLAGVESSDHRPAASGKDLRKILRDVRIDSNFLDAAKALIAEHDRLASTR